jgi:type I restriction enzyme S subunit
MYPGSHDEQGIPLIRAADISEGRISETPTLKISKNVHYEYRRTALEGGECLLTLVGTPGIPAIVPHSMAGWNVARAVAVLRLTEQKNARFLRYAFSSPDVQNTIRNWCNTTVQRTLNLGDIKKIPISWPPIATRETITETLGALDDKIDLNRRTNETLEAMARALFRGWFVDFGPTRAKMAGQTPYLAPEIWELFPDRLDDEGKPEGWKTTSISSLCSITSGKRPPNKVSSPSIENPVPVYGGNGISWFTKDILFNERFLITGRVGTLGTVFRVSEECWVSDNALCLFPKINSLFEYAYFVLSDVDFQSLNSGSTQPLLTQTSLGAQQCILPQRALVNIFHEQVFLWFDRQSQIEKQNQSLAQLRDLLLPKLMSGEIRIRDAEKMVADAL